MRPKLHPCRKCLLLPCCTKHCDRVSKRQANSIQESIMEHSECPDCGATIHGKQISQMSPVSTVYCKLCRHKFCITGKFAARTEWDQGRIIKMSEYGIYKIVRTSNE